MASSTARRQVVSHADASAEASAIQPRLCVGSASGATCTEAMPLAALKARTLSGSRESSGQVFDASRCQPWRVACQVRGHRLARQRRGVPLRGIAGVELAVDERHPRLAARRRPSSSHTPQARLSHSSTSVLMKARKKPSMSVSRTTQVERQLHGVALDPRHAVGAALRIEGRGQLPFQLDRPRVWSPEDRLGTVEHALDYPADGPPASIGRWTEPGLIPKDDVQKDEAGQA